MSVGEGGRIVSARFWSPIEALKECRVGRFCIQILEDGPFNEIRGDKDNVI